MLAASIVIYTLFLTLVSNKRAKPTMSNGSLSFLSRPQNCARLVTNKYVFFTKPSYHPSREVGCLATDPCAWVVLRLGEKNIFIAYQTLTILWSKRMFALPLDIVGFARLLKTRVKNRV